MIFRTIEPDPELSRFVDSYWMASDPDTTPRQKKIIPDGFCEIIFHFGDPYRICLNGAWQPQSRSLLAGQIDKHFYLENTGASEMIGIKLKPAALASWYRLPMHEFTNTVKDLSAVLGKEWSIHEAKFYSLEATSRITWLSSYFKNLVHGHNLPETPAEQAAEIIFRNHGMVQVSDLCDALGLGERQVENIFKRDVGLSPKRFSRIVRFSYIFQVVQENHNNWCDVAYGAAFYDQSHFIRNFKNFTGENPADYAFDERTLANFFLRKNLK